MASRYFAHAAPRIQPAPSRTIAPPQPAQPTAVVLLHTRRGGASPQALAIQLQRTVGNRATHALIQRLGAQPAALPRTGGLPGALRAGVERASGLALDDVQVHYNSERPAQVQAWAYTQGREIHLAPGQERHLAHEAWHVVQQRQGRVRPTGQVQGLAVNDDLALEQEATVRGAQAAQGGRAGAAPPAVPQPAPTEAPSAPVVQRAITVGTKPVPRTADIPASQKTFLTTNGLFGAFQALNDERTIIYIFQSDDHLLEYLKEATGQPTKGPVLPPLTQKISPAELDEGHRRAQDVRFSNIYQPAPHQMPAHAPGVHKIEPAMMPPPGEGHHYMQASTTLSGKPEYTLFANKLVPPKPTLPLTYGTPSAPSLVMYQNDLNLGMHIQPAKQADLDPITRAQSTYGGISSDTGRVRGHPFALEQNQRSTDKKTTFDKDKRTYTDESDSTKATGGMSSWRYNEIEKKSIKAKQSFTQVNLGPTKGKMGIVKPKAVHYRVRQGPGKHDDILIDNTGATDYRNAKLRPGKKRKQENQTQMGREAAVAQPYQPPPIHQPGEDFDDPMASTYPGFLDAPPSPFLATSTLAGPTIPVSVPGVVRVGEQITHNGRPCLVVDVIATANNTTACLVQEIPQGEWPTFV